MAREKALWQRMKDGATLLTLRRHRVHLKRIENSVGSGHPDVEGCIDGRQVWIELKSEDRPARQTTPLSPAYRHSQRLWHKERCAAGCTHNWILLQIGEGRGARLYLVPGFHYESLMETRATEGHYADLSYCDPCAHIDAVLLTASLGW
jgi:hypothetical protein